MSFPKFKTDKDATTFFESHDSTDFIKETVKVNMWVKENHLSQEDIKAGRIKKFSTKAEAMKWLKK